MLGVANLLVLQTMGIYILVSPAAGPAEAGPRKAVLGVCAVSPVDAS